MAATRMQNDRPNNYQVAPRIGERRIGRITPLRRGLPYIVGAAVGMAIVRAVIARPPEAALVAMAATVSPSLERPTAAVLDQTANRVSSPLISRRVISSPPGAELLRHGTVLGTTPIELELTQSEEAEPVTLRLAGYLEQMFEIMPDQPGTTYVVLKRASQLVFHERDCDLECKLVLDDDGPGCLPCAHVYAPMPLAGRGEP